VGDSHRGHRRSEEYGRGCRDQDRRSAARLTAASDGKLLRWQALRIEQTTPLAPFFIQWEAGSPHPSSDSPRLGTAKSLRFETPEPDELRRILQAAAIQADIRKSNLPRIVLMVLTARGEIEMS